MILYLDSHRTRVATLLSKLQHASAGIPLLMIGVPKLMNDAAERPMALVEVSIALLVLVAFLREVRAELRHSEGPHSAFGWFDFAAGALQIFEAFHGAHEKPGYLRPVFLSGTVTLGLGLFHSRLQARARRRCYLKLDDVGLKFRPSRFRWYSLRWEQVASVEIGGSKITFHKKDGGNRWIRLRLFRNADEIRGAIVNHPQAAALITAAPPPAVESSSPPVPQ